MRRFVLYLVAAVMLFCGAFSPQHTAARTNKALMLYTDALKRLTIYSDTTSAYRLSTEALKIDSTYTPAAYLLSRIESNPEKAWKQAERALSSDSTNNHYLEAAAEQSLRAKHFERAKHHLQRLVKDGQEMDHFRLLALLHSMSQEREQAIAVLDSAEVRFGKVDFFSRMRQQLYLESGNVEQALKSAIELTTEAPYVAENQIALADVYAATGADSLAEATYLKAIELDKTNPSTHYSYAGFLDSRKRYTEMLLTWRNIVEFPSVPLDAKITIVESITSKRDFYRKNFLLVEPIITRLYQLYPQNSKVVDIYIHHLVAANRIKEALEVLKQRLSKDKPTIEELDRIIELEVYLDRYDSVEEYVNRGIELYPTHDKFWNLKAWLQTKRGDNQGAINTLKTALKQTKEPAARSSIWGSIGDQYYELKAFKKSYAAYNKALSYNFDNVVVLNNYAYHLSTIGKSLNQALTMAKRATELSPNNGTYLDTLAWVYYKLGEYEEAKKTMQQAMSFDKSNSSELALHYGDILDALGNTFMAQTYWRKALERGADASLIESRIEAQKARLEAQKAGK